MLHEAPLIVFSHLKWDFVYQRPQHLMARFAANRRVIFIEEPEYIEGVQAHWQRSMPEPNVLVCRARIPVLDAGFGDKQLALLTEMLAELIQEEELYNYVAWLYTPMAVPLAKTLKPQVVVYDCMDELSAFKFAPVRLIEREKELLEWADLVFTGGPSLYGAKKDRHHSVHCFSSSVDTEHFRQATTLPDATDQAELARPRLGYYGVIDERIDLRLLDGVAQAHPDWQVVVVGPVVKIDPESLPKRPNIHYMGQRHYKELPSFLAGWDVCLMPFALNESTKYISPTKVLEYMAAELPIVSTPVTDIAEPYGDIVYLANSVEEFNNACEQALEETANEKHRRVARGRDVLSHTSWDSTAAQMERLIVSVLDDRNDRSKERRIGDTREGLTTGITRP